MYLHKKHYVKNWEHTAEDKKVEVTVTRGGKPMKEIDVTKICYIEEDVAYWRKANAIHQWFVKNCNEGDDDNGKDMYIERSQLEELLESCQFIKARCKLKKGMIKNGSTYVDGKEIPNMEAGKIMTNKKYAEKLIPTQSGFFFGSTDYDEYYMQDIDHTIKVLTEELKKDDGADYYYHSSW